MFWSFEVLFSMSFVQVKILRSPGKLLGKTRAGYGDLAVIGQ
jgi:hypothetical protein